LLLVLLYHQYEVVVLASKSDENTNFVRRIQIPDDAGTTPEEAYPEIIGGDPVKEAIVWYAVFADTTICGGALVSSNMQSAFDLIGQAVLHDCIAFTTQNFDLHKHFPYFLAS